MQQKNEPEILEYFRILCKYKGKMTHFKNSSFKILKQSIYFVFMEEIPSCMTFFPPYQKKKKENDYILV